MFFRSENILNSFEYLLNMIMRFSIPYPDGNFILLIFLLLLFEWTFLVKNISIFNYKSKFIRLVIYIFIFNACIATITEAPSGTFIYFQF